MKKFLFTLVLSLHLCNHAVALNPEEEFINKIIEGFSPLSDKGVEWQCRVSTMHMCNKDDCETVAEKTDSFEVDLQKSRYRLCSTKKWLIANDTGGECLNWIEAQINRPGIYTVIAAQNAEGYVKIENTSLEFIAVTNFLGLSNKTYLGKCFKKA